MSVARTFLNNKDSIKRKLESKREITKEGCWLWTGFLMPSGYGQTGIRNTHYLVHRLSLYAYTDFDLDNEDIQALHKLECKNKNCFNPDHLYAGTHKDNMKDLSQTIRSTNIFIVCGHPRDIENTYHDRRRGKVQCKKCHRDTEREKYRNRFRCGEESRDIGPTNQ